MKKQTDTLKVLSLFSGCGGMDLGFEGGFTVLRKSINEKIHPNWLRDPINNHWIRLPKTTFKTVFANDILSAAKASWIPYFDKEARNGFLFHSESIVDLVKKHVSGEAKVFPEVDLVTGGFPCQDFSVAGKRKGFNSHKGHHGGLLNGTEASQENRGKLYMWMKAVIEIVRPKVFIAENVKGLVSLADAKKIIENDFRSIGGDGYLVVDAKVLRAQDYGVPQTRERVIFIGFKRDALAKEAIKQLAALRDDSRYSPYPRRTHGDQKHCSNLSPYVKVRDAFVGLKEPERSSDPAQMRSPHLSYSL